MTVGAGATALLRRSQGDSPLRDGSDRLHDDRLLGAIGRSISLGYFFGAVPLGYFQNAFLLYDNALSLFTQLHDIAVASLSKLRNDVDELKRSCAAALSSLSFFSCRSICCPCVLAVTAQDFVVMLLGQKWAPSGPLVCIFAVKGIAHVVERSLGWLHVAAGQPDRWMRWGVFSAICQLVAVFAGIPFGLAGVAAAHAIVTFCLFIPALVPALIRFALPFSAEAKEIWARRRALAKRYDSYQWQKLLWIGLGLLPHVTTAGQVAPGEIVVTAICLIGGSMGLLIWSKVSGARSPLQP